MAPTLDKSIVFSHYLAIIKYAVAKFLAKDVL